MWARIFEEYKGKYGKANLGLFKIRQDLLRDKLMVYTKGLRGEEKDGVVLKWPERAPGQEGYFLRQVG